MNRVFRMTNVLLLLLLAAATPATAAEESSLEFDLAADDAVVEEHTARLLWNLMTDNIVHESVTSWNSLYLEKPETISGKVVADLDAGTISGEITERWRCEHDCLTSLDTPSWTTSRDTGWTATITGGRLEADGPGWTISGSVTIRYKATVTQDEEPSECDGSPCYVCDQHLCKVGGEAAATVDLTGWIDGDTLSLAFADGLKTNIDDVELESLLRTEFFMSLFSLTITGAIVPVAEEPPPDESAPDDPTVSETAADGGAVDVPSGQVIPGVDAGSPPGEFGDDTNADDGEQPDVGEERVTEAGASVESDSDDGGGLSAIGLMIAAILIIIALGGGAWIKFKGYLRWFERKAEEGDAARRSVRPPRSAEPKDPTEKTYQVGDSAVTYSTTVERVPAPPTFTMIGTKESDYKWVDGIDKYNQVHRWDHGTEVVVLERKGDRARVQAPGSTPIWIDRRHLRMKPPPEPV